MVILADYVQQADAPATSERWDLQARLEPPRTRVWISLQTRVSPRLSVWTSYLTQDGAVTIIEASGSRTLSEALAHPPRVEGVTKPSRATGAASARLPSLLAPESIVLSPEFCSLMLEGDGESGP